MTVNNGSGNGLPPTCHQAIGWTNNDYLAIEKGEFESKLYTFLVGTHFKK